MRAAIVDSLRNKWAIGLAAVVLAYWSLVWGPFSLRAAYDRDVAGNLARVSPSAAVTEQDLAALPRPVSRYLRTVGVVGQPRVNNMRAQMHGRIRNGPDARWMPLTAEQHNTFEPGRRARLFYLRAWMFALPLYGYHRYVDDAATMLVKLGGVIPVARLSASEGTFIETVTMFNDMCLMAPATLIDPTIRWEPVDDLLVRAVFTNAGHAIRAELLFNDAGDLVEFRSDDRRQADVNGRLTQIRWSTPVRAYRSFGAVRLFSTGDARWHEPTGEYAYIELTLDDVQYNVTGR
jgi:hypothetical protein